MPRTKVFNETEVLEKAVQVFWHKGYNGTSAQYLVDELGISRSSLYDTYGDKKNLFMKALQYYRSVSAAGLIELVVNSKDIEETIEQLFNIAVKESLEDKLLKGCFMVNTTIELAPHDEEIAALANQNMNDIEQALYTAIKRGQEEGKLSTRQSARALARFLFNTLSGLRVASKSGADKVVLDDIVQVALSVLKSEGGAASTR